MKGGGPKGSPLFLAGPQQQSRFLGNRPQSVSPDLSEQPE